MKPRHRPSLRWNAPGVATEGVRAALADVLGCAFTDEVAPRSGLCPAPDVTFAAIVEPGRVKLVAHFRDIGLPFTTKVSWLHELVTEACAAAGLPGPAPPAEVEVGSQA